MKSFLRCSMLAVLISLVPDVGSAQSGQFPTGFNTVRLGMDLEQTKEALLSDPYFDFRGDPDVSLLPSPNETLIECRGFTYIERGFFQFYEGRLYTITLMLSRTELDHYTMYQTLSEKYGSPTKLDPTKASWESETVMITLERPLTVKYLDWQTFEQIREEGKAAEQVRELIRDEFLELF